MPKEVVYKLGELFCGPGGLALGAKKARVVHEEITYRVKPTWANDIDQYACRTYAQNIKDGDSANVYCAPVGDLDFLDLPDFNALAFGFPCNDFSIVGEQKGMYGEYGPLYSYGVKAINQYKPLWFIAENVSGLQTANSGEAFARILYELETAGSGYVVTPHLYKFEDYSVPQCRHRIVIVGIRHDLNYKFKVPAPTSGDNHITVGQALLDQPINKSAPNNEATKQSTTVVERLKHIPPGKNAWHPSIPKHLQLNVKGARLSQIYKRLDQNEPAYTITGSGGGGTHVYHWKENRALTNRERARLQTFPDNFVFAGSKEQVRKQIGMAVPPLAAQIIVEAILKTFAGMPYAFIEPAISNGQKDKSLQLAL